MTYEQQADKFLTDTNTTLTVEYVKYGQMTWDEDRRNYRHIFKFRIENELGHYESLFGQSIADGDKTPTSYNILTCLEKYEPESFENWCSQFGYDEDSRKAYSTWETCCEQYEALAEMFTDEEMDLLREIQ